MKNKLYPQQNEVYQFLVEYIDKHQHSPSRQEIAQKLNLHVSTIKAHLKVLKQKDYIDWEQGGKRNIIILGQPSKCPPIPNNFWKNVDEKDYELYFFIRNYISEHQQSPTIKELMEGLEIKSSNTIQKQLRRLKESGYIDWLDNKRRSITVLK
ncbi:winged helix-turn-helix transcriptional regulator [Gloeothece verrucosa]|uniref:Transcriptional repressor, LexA family n=1 Tax=Gloeothece verrucosa (strain PCC 7822) TaxID=497965 RepID=E0UNB4_GLOV7|nr:winged helix-turn-helix transcriptional regulator [Gloeothece verrucosa]ADN18444.1 transcriptional repressor, LexA family [Gloeothece verrucosa PCC 7822]